MPFSHRAIPVIAPPVLGAWLSTVRMRWCETGHARAARELSRGVIYAIWHETLIYFVWSHRRRGIGVMISRHKDGELVARTAERFGFCTARGSSTRGGSGALRELARLGEEGRDLCITPDGPRGPRRHVQPGIIDLARRTGLAILPAALAYRHCRRLRSWDRMAIPHPFTPAVVLFGEPLLVAAEAGPGGGGEEEPRGLLESRLCSLSERAEADFGLLYAAGEASLEGFDPTPRLRSAPGPRNR